MNRLTSLRKTSHAIVLFVAISCTAQTTPSQTAAATTAPTFDVASIHVHTPAPYEGTKIISSPNSGNFQTVNLTLKALMEHAFDMPRSRILNAPDWTSTQPFDIDAKSDDALEQRLHSLPPDQAKPIKLAMVQALLADRFGLKTHREQRELPIYTLVVAKNGSKLSPSKFDGRLIHHGLGSLNAQGITLPVIAQELSHDAGRVIIDKTNLPGRFDIDLHWQPDDEPPMRLNGDEVNLPSLFTALQEQLGLRLESAKGPVEVLVIDDVHQPTAN
jgi:uncharacterized protein (TIGR03435 family)